MFLQLSYLYINSVNHVTASYSQVRHWNVLRWLNLTIKRRIRQKIKIQAGDLIKKMKKWYGWRCEFNCFQTNRRGLQSAVRTQMHPERLLNQSVFVECLSQTVVLWDFESCQVKLRDAPGAILRSRSNTKQFDGMITAWRVTSLLMMTPRVDSQ